MCYVPLYRRIELVCVVGWGGVFCVYAYMCAYIAKRCCTLPSMCLQIMNVFSFACFVSLIHCSLCNVLYMYTKTALA